MHAGSGIRALAPNCRYHHQPIQTQRANRRQRRQHPILKSIPITLTSLLRGQTPASLARLARPMKSAFASIQLDPTARNPQSRQH